MERVVVWSGDVDIAQQAELHQQWTAAVDEPDTTGLTFDLAAVTFIDSIGLALLLDARNTGLDRGIPVTLRSPSGLVQRLLQVAGVDQIFTIT